MRIVVAEAASFGEASARAFLELAGANVVAGLPTGNTPIPLYGDLKRLAARGEARIDGVTAFAIDEYGGPAEHPCSNRSFFRQHWDVIPGAMPVRCFDAMAADLDREFARFDADLAAAGGLGLAVLGIGMNGHLAFNEPGSKRGSGTRRLALTEASRESARACWGEEPPRFGVTLGLRDLLGAGSVLLLANGAKKAAIVARALAGPVGSDCPASYIQQYDSATVVLDREAASSLPDGISAVFQ